MSTIFSTLLLLLLIFTLVQCTTDRQKRQGLIVPPKQPHSTNGTNAIYNPAGKPAAPTKLPAGIIIPSGPLYAPGKVVTKPAAPSTSQHQASSEAKQPHQHPHQETQQQQHQQQKPQHHQQHPINQHPGILDILNALLGTTTGTSTHNPLGVNFEQLPPNADVNIKVIQPFYSRPRQTGYIIGSRPMPVQPYSSYQAVSYYGSYPRRLQDTAGNDQEEQTITI